MWLEGSARKAAAQRHPFSETPVLLTQRYFPASFCWRKIEKVIAPSARVRFHAVRARPERGDVRYALRSGHQSAHRQGPVVPITDITRSPHRHSRAAAAARLARALWRFSY